ncbi:MAG: DNA polymerase III subunit delta, partial [Bacteroidetes bacterium]|nr:DNA polymerase III subunit delta [Bacteroidota bacterium]
MRFADIPGLDEIKGNLIKCVLSNKIPHAQLLQGHEGSGNLVLSLAYASYLNCLNRTENDSCGECAACSKIDKLIHPDLHLVFPVSPNAKFTGKDVISANYLNEWRSFILKNPYQNLNDWNNYYGADNKQGNISKEESRQIIKNLSLMAFEGQFKVMLIWLPEWMHPSAANSILKILEEPPDRTLFLMVSHQADNLLP